MTRDETAKKAIREHFIAQMPMGMVKTMNRAWWSLQLGPFDAAHFAEEEGCSVEKLSPPWTSYSDAAHQLEVWALSNLPAHGAFYDHELRVVTELPKAALPKDLYNELYLYTTGALQRFTRHEVALALFGDLMLHGGVDVR